MEPVPGWFHSAGYAVLCLQFYPNVIWQILFGKSCLTDVVWQILFDRCYLAAGWLTGWLAGGLAVILQEGKSINFPLWHKRETAIILFLT